VRPQLRPSLRNEQFQLTESRRALLVPRPPGTLKTLLQRQPVPAPAVRPRQSSHLDRSGPVLTASPALTAQTLPARTSLQKLQLFPRKCQQPLQKLQLPKRDLQFPHGRALAEQFPALESRLTKQLRQPLQAEPELRLDLNSRRSKALLLSAATKNKRAGELSKSRLRTTSTASSLLRRLANLESHLKRCQVGELPPITNPQYFLKRPSPNLSKPPTELAGLSNTKTLFSRGGFRRPPRSPTGALHLWKNERNGAG
jgi:hypothetical protein